MAGFYFEELVSFENLRFKTKWPYKHAIYGRSGMVETNSRQTNCGARVMENNKLCTVSNRTIIIFDDL